MAKNRPESVPANAYLSATSTKFGERKMRQNPEKIEHAF
jgi:hypothetical protein